MPMVKPGWVLVIILVVLLLISGGVIYWQHGQIVEAAETYGKAKQLADDTRASAMACSRSVDDLRTEGKKRDGRILAALNAVAPAVKADQEASLRALQAMPTDAKKLCESLQLYLQGEIKAERKIP